MSQKRIKMSKNNSDGAVSLNLLLYKMFNGPNQEIKREHLKKTLAIYRRSKHYQIFSRELDEIELDNIAAAATGEEGLVPCPYCGKQVPSFKLDKHISSLHKSLLE